MVGFSLNAHLPPKENAGLSLWTLPLKKTGEFSRLIEGLMKAYRRFSAGIMLYGILLNMIKKLKVFLIRFTKQGFLKFYSLKCVSEKKSSSPTMNGSGMIIINPPYLLENEIKKLSPFLINCLGQDENAQITHKWLQKNI